MNLWHIYHEDIPDFLLKAAQTPAMQRLRHIGMNCGCEYTSFPEFSMCDPYSRYDHSIAVALIVWHFTKNKAQSLSGLLHDIATPVFAHVIDFANGDHLTQESTEDRTEEMIRGSSELMAILQENSLCAADVENYHQYPVADNRSPLLCADRLEYTLGNAVNYRFITQVQAEEFYRDLTVGTNETGQIELMFQTPEIAFRFANISLKCSQVYVSDADRYAMQILAEIILDAIHDNVIYREDLYTTEAAVIRKIMNSAYSKRWQAFCNLSKTQHSLQPNTNQKWRQIPAKKRFIDPYVVKTGRVTALFITYQNDLHRFKEEPQDYWIAGS